MAIYNTLQSPPIWSPAYNPIIWMIESDKTTEYKFRYVFDVYVDSNPKVRFKVPPNPNGKGLIDVSALVAAQIDITTNLPFLSTDPFYMGDALAAKVYILAGEEYASTPTGSTVIYNGLGAVGEPAYGLYADSNFRPAPNATTPVVAWNSGQNAEKYYTYLATGGEDILEFEMALGQVNDTGGRFLTNCPDSPQSIRSDENFTLTWLNRNFEAATGPQTFPYGMRVDLYNNNTSVGSTFFYNTVAEGGVWPTCSTPPSATGGASGPENFLESFKINPADITTYTRTKFDIWGPQTDPPYYRWQFGPYGPLGDVFPSIVDTGLTPPYTGAVNINEDDGTWITALPYTGVTGSTEIAYKTMVAATGSVLDIQLQSANTWGTSYPQLQLWGCKTTGFTAGANWEIIGSFSAIQSPATKIYYTFSGVTTKKYFALGLRLQIQNSSQWNQSLIGPYDYPGPLAGYPVINAWNITSPLESTFNKMCLSLLSYDNYSSCAEGDTPISETICLNIDDTNCWGFEPIRFTWMNQLGGRDWFTFIKRNTFVQQSSRTTLYKLPGYWSAASYSVFDNQPARYGTTVFQNNLMNTWTASTDWLTEEQSAWLREMFASPSVFAYLPGRTQPVGIIIQDAEYSVQTIRRENLFQYFVSFVESLPDNVQAY